VTPEAQLTAKAAYSRRLRADRRWAAYAIAGRRCACGEPATCMPLRPEHLPASGSGLARHGYTMSSQRLREELARREPACRRCASRRAHESRRLVRDPVVMSRRIREAIDGI
jgi:hypothetical protein